MVDLVSVLRLEVGLYDLVEFWSLGLAYPSCVVSYDLARSEGLEVLGLLASVECDVSMRDSRMRS